MPIRCEIVSQDRVVFSGDADLVILPGGAGELGVLPNHSPLLTTLQYGIITVRSKGVEDQYFTVAGGIAEVQPDQVTVLADAAESVDEIDAERAENARRRAEEALRTGIPKDTDEYLRLRAALLRSTLRLKAVERYKKGKRMRG